MLPVTAVARAESAALGVSGFEDSPASVFMAVATVSSKRLALLSGVGWVFQPEELKLMSRGRVPASSAALNAAKSAGKLLPALTRYPLPPALGMPSIIICYLRI